MTLRWRAGAAPRRGRHPAALAAGVLLGAVGASTPAHTSLDPSTDAARQHRPLAAHAAAADRGGDGAVSRTTTAIAAATHASATSAVLPESLTDVDGDHVDVAALAARGQLVVVTLKATWCPVCQEQLVRLRKLLPRLRSCGATFLVLAPGPADELRQIARDTGFPYPFIEDRDLEIARAANLVLAPDQITPAILVLDGARRVTWMQRGRSGAHYGDGELLDRLACEPLGTA